MLVDGVCHRTETLTFPLLSRPLANVLLILIQTLEFQNFKIKDIL